MLGPAIVVLIVGIVVLILIGTSGGRRSRGRESTAGHSDPDAIGGFTLDPATMRYRYDLPTLPPGESPMATGTGPPHRRRRRHRRPDTGHG